jgi:SAM-dependent methyltransferase
VASLNAKEQWLARLSASLREGSFVKVTLGGPRSRSDTLRNVFVRPVELKGGRRLSFVYRHPTRDVTRNFTLEEALARIEELAGGTFRHAHLFTAESTVELTLRESEEARLIVHKTAQSLPSSGTHDQPKRRLIDSRAGWLHALGVTTADGRVAKGMEAKFRQINKFVEVLGHLLAESARSRREEALAHAECGVWSAELDQSLLTSAPANELAVVDMGCGKGYLTFAAYDWLRRSGWGKATVRGIEARPDLVTLCNRVAKQSQFDDLRFETGNIADSTLGHVDVLIALHACDTATDDAIAKGVRGGASLILVSPCCHKELRPQLRPPPALAGALRHGILLERQAEFATDALRAALLEWAGYDTKVFEFVSTEHTAKNLMIAATKRAVGQASSRPPGLPAPGRISGRMPGEAGWKPAPLAARVRELAALYGIRQQRLACNLGFNLVAQA